jgi:hypothetical protein
MKSFFTLIFLLFVLLIQAQTSFSDDFESYTNGAYVAQSNAKWSTWSKMPGTGEDAKISNEQAKSGQQSLKIISASSSGGTTDLLLPFGAAYKSGSFTYKMNMFVPTDKNAYFNFQATTTPGQTWAMDAYFFESGNMVFAKSSAVLISTRYPTNKWFELEVEINLNYKLWKIKLDGVCVGSFYNNVSIASIDFYPTDGASLYYVDDVSFEHKTTASALAFDGGISEFVWHKGKLTGTKDVPEIVLRNYGDSILRSYDLEVNFNGTTKTLSKTGLNITKGQSTKVLLEEIELGNGANTFNVNLAKINGTTSDGEPCNNSTSFALNAVTAAPNRTVLVEEGTGPWCQWCPRGAVFMDRFDSYYKGKFIPIAVHNGTTNPMKIAEYDAFMDFPGFPNCKVNRDVVLDPSSSEVPFLNEISIAPKAKITPGAKYNSGSRELKVSAVVEFLEDVDGEFFTTLVLTEDGVKGTTAAYNQSNAYAGGSNGVMGGYELLANPVPAAQMKYDHVARAVSGLESEAANSFAGSYKKGDKVVLNYTFNIATTWKIDSMHIVPILLESSGSYVNAATSTYSEAIAAGFISGNQEVTLPATSVSIYPNPADDQINIELSLETPSDVEVSIMQVSGQELSKRTFSSISGEQILPINLMLLNDGVYLVKVKTNQGIRLEKVVVK